MIETIVLWAVIVMGALDIIARIQRLTSDEAMRKHVERASSRGIAAGDLVIGTVLVTLAAVALFGG